MNARKPEEAVFAAALQLVGGERAAYLDRACAGDAELRQRVEARLAAHDQSPTAAGEPEGPARPRNPTIKLKFEAESEVSERIGRYKLLQKIGEGGCGVVYMAEQEEPVRRRVALKVIKPGMDTKQVLARFEAERQALALMDHPKMRREIQQLSARVMNELFDYCGLWFRANTEQRFSDRGLVFTWRLGLIVLTRPYGSAP